MEVPVLGITLILVIGALIGFGLGIIVGMNIMFKMFSDELTNAASKVKPTIRA